MLKHASSPVSSPSYAISPVHRKCSDTYQTTPKLPKKDRLAVLSRLLNSEFREMKTELSYNSPIKTELRYNSPIKTELRYNSPIKTELLYNSPIKTELRYNSPKKTEFRYNSPVKTNQRYNGPNKSVFEQFVDSAPTINLLPCSPSDLKKLLTRGSPCKSMDFGLLPHSPITFKDESPMKSSPTYATPTKSPLYLSENKSSHLGRGSFGNVTLLGSKFALKVVRNCSEVGEENLLKIRHPHLVSILHVSHFPDKTCIFMEFAGNCNLQQILNTKSELDFHRKLSFCIQTLSGLRHCHKHNIVHADVKPANVIVSPHGICKLGDFGHSIILDETSGQKRRSKDELVGTVGYTAPEILCGSHSSMPADIYSFGIFLWQMHTREIPFAGEHPHVVIYKVVNYDARPTLLINNKDEVLNSFANLIRLCWNSNSIERPTASCILKILQDLMLEVKNGVH